MGIYIWVVIGLIVGVLTLLIEPRVIKKHIIITLLLGVVGAVAGGAVGSFLGLNEQKGMHFMIVVLSFVFSVFVLTWYRTFEKYFFS